MKNVKLFLNKTVPVTKAALWNMKTFKVITEFENYKYTGVDKFDVECQVIRDFFPEVLDDDLPDKMETIEIVEL